MTKESDYPPQTASNFGLRKFLAAGKILFLGICLGGLALLLTVCREDRTSHRQLEETRPKSRILERKPTVYTFFDDLNGRSTPDQDLRVWERSWQDAGWNTRVLTKQSADNHPLTPKMTLLLEGAGSKLNIYEQMCFYRWAAMADAVPEEGGWMTDIDVLPLHISSDEGINLPNDGRFTCHDNNIPDLMSGSKSEWERMLGLLLLTWKTHTGYLSDMYLLGTILVRYREEAAIFLPVLSTVYEGFFSTSIGQVDCNPYSRPSIKVVHFSHNSLDRAFLGGWLEAGIRQKYGEDVAFSVTNNGVLVEKDANGTMYKNVEGDLPRFVVIIGKEKEEHLHRIFSRNRGTISALFMRDIVQQCL